MIESVLLSVCLCLPQGGQGEPRIVGVDENGWPIYESSGSGSEPAPSPEQPAAAPVAESAPAPRPKAPTPHDLESPLRDVFRRVGQPADLEDLAGVTAWYELVIRDHRGGELARREVTHEADLRFADRDRLLLPGRKVYGRDGNAVYAELHRLPMPSYESEAAEELELAGLLLRAPWAFADDRKFRVHAPTYVMVGRQRVLRIVVTRIPPVRDQATAVADEPTDRFELYCDPHSFDPFELRYTLCGTGVERRMKLSDYERLGAVRVPMRRAIVDDAGNPTLEWNVLRVDSGLRFVQSQFRPLTR